ncbi:GNAT family acetyltransferase [Photobacterium jeanii]|uniref:GNAT family acetyltransferase n=1 Tax=Photobacterium jeanii TaxID=858640 RepID=A0A178KLN2_9GAMM|nr:GNAT family protein [Photobacterium jeanii]OAN18161.1 GNAT family acetyltransferase [Photobacterium jeanii]PST92163.1 N-acetyltransferase [Photobacterium jeanii]
MLLNSETIDSLKRGNAIPLTPELTISLIKADDLADIITMLDNPKVTEFLFFAPAPVEVYQSFFQPIIDNTTEAIAHNEWPKNPTLIVRNQQGDYMGMGGLSAVMFLQGNVEIGYQLPEHAWGKGIATAITRLLTELAFKALAVHKVSADCYANNIGSYRTLENCGFTQEGRQKDYYKLENGFDDRLFYGMTAQEFATLTD